MEVEAELAFELGLEHTDFERMDRMEGVQVRRLGSMPEAWEMRCRDWPEAAELALGGHTDHTEAS